MTLLADAVNHRLSVIMAGGCSWFGCMVSGSPSMEPVHEVSLEERVVRGIKKSHIRGGLNRDKVCLKHEHKRDANTVNKLL